MAITILVSTISSNLRRHFYIELKQRRRPGLEYRTGVWDRRERRIIPPLAFGHSVASPDIILSSTSTSDSGTDCSFSLPSLRTCWRLGTSSCPFAVEFSRMNCQESLRHCPQQKRKVFAKHTHSTVAIGLLYGQLGFIQETDSEDRCHLHTGSCEFSTGPIPRMYAVARVETFSTCCGERKKRKGNGGREKAVRCGLAGSVNRGNSNAGSPMGRAAAGFQRREDYSGRAQARKRGTWEGSGGGGRGAGGAVVGFGLRKNKSQPRDHRTYLINPHREFQSAARRACTNATEQRARAP